MKNYNLFLDDIRNPSDVLLYTNSENLVKLYSNLSWVVVRNYEDFVNYIKKNGLPEVVSFDHDLGEDEAKSKVDKGMSKKKARAEKKEVKSGYDCAKWMVDYCISNDKKLPQYYSHSMNPVGRENILNYLRNFDKQQ